MKLTPTEMLADARKNNPNIRYALRKEKTADGGSVLGAFCINAGGFIPVATEKNGVWERFPNLYLSVDGKPVGIEPENWIE